MENQNQTPHKRRVRYKGKYPKKFEIFASIYIIYM